MFLNKTKQIFPETEMNPKSEVSPLEIQGILNSERKNSNANFIESNIKDKKKGVLTYVL